MRGLGRPCPGVTVGPGADSDPRPAARRADGRHHAEPTPLLEVIALTREPVDPPDVDLPPIVGPADLLWWRDLSRSLDWIWAKTYAESAPHHYVVLGRTPGVTRDDLVRAGAVIRAFGQPGKFHSSTNIYLQLDGFKYWTMDRRVVDTDLINRADAAATYGPQDAPATANGRFNEYDGIAADYDRRRNADCDGEVAARIAEHFRGRSPRTLDVGCGAGALLDLELVQPTDYTGVDCSQGMLNELVLKYPAVHRVIPARFEDLSDEDLAAPYDVVAALDVPGLDVERLLALCSGIVVTVRGGSVQVMHVTALRGNP